MAADISDNDKAILAELLRDTIAADRFPLSPRIKSLRPIFEQLEPSVARPEAIPPAKPPGEPGMAMRKKRRR